MIPDGQKSESRTWFGDKEPPKSLSLKQQQPLGYVAGTSACLDCCPIIPLPCGKQCGLPSWFVGNGRKPSSVLFVIFDPFNVCCHQDPSVTCPRVSGPSWFLPMGQEDFCRGVSTEELPCSHPAFGDTQNFAKQGFSVLTTGSIQSIYFYLFF